MTSQRSRVAGRILAPSVVVLVGLAITFGVSGVAAAAVVPTVGLGTAAGFGALGGSTVTNTGPSTVDGLNVGVSPGSAVTGFPPGIITPPGTLHQADAVAGIAQGDALTAFNDAAGRSAAPADQGLTDLVGKTLAPGVYQGNLSLTGTVTLDNRTDPDAVFIFQASSTLITGSSSVVKFTTAHPSCNVFWEVHDSATLGTDSTFVGTVLAHISVTAQTGATITGRLLADTGAVTLDTNTITAPSCAPATTSTPPTTSSTPPTTPRTTTTGPPVTSTGSTSGTTGSSSTTSRSTTTTRTTPSAPNENTTPSTISLLTTSPGAPSTSTGTSISTSTATPRTTSSTIVTTETTAQLTQPSFPTGVPGGSGPPAPISPVKVVGAFLALLGALLLLGQIPAVKRLATYLVAMTVPARRRRGEHS